MPIEQDSSVSASTARWTAPANASGSSVTAPRKASSQPITSTAEPGTSGSTNVRSTSITRSEASS